MTPKTRRALALVLTLGLVAAGAPAVAAERPGNVGLVSFVGASLTSSGATLTLDWAPVADATSYELFVATSYSGVLSAPVPATSSSKSAATITGLAPGTDYFVQVRGVSSAGAGPRSNPVGHSTITAEATGAAITAAPAHRVLTWNMCSVMCANLATRAKAMHRRIGELRPGIVVFQEASRITKAPTGYRFAVNGQNDILYRASAYTLLRNSKYTATGSAVFASKYATRGKGVAWAVLRHTATGKYVVMLDVHLLAGGGTAATRQRQYEASRIAPYIAKIVSALKARFPSVASWSNVPVLVAGDFNTTKTRFDDATTAILERSGWYEAFDQARVINGQHINTANARMSTVPVLGLTWGDHVDKVLVRASRSIVVSWTSAGKMANGRYVTPLPSDHHPLLVVVKTI